MLLSLTVEAGAARMRRRPSPRSMCVITFYLTRSLLAQLAEPYRCEMVTCSRKMIELALLVDGLL